MLPVLQCGFQHCLVDEKNLFLKFIFQPFQMSKIPHIVVLTGAGISSESGIKTFRDSCGLWVEFSIEDVATIDAWVKNRELVLEFYNQRRKQVMAAKPNGFHCCRRAAITAPRRVAKVHTDTVKPVVTKMLSA